MAEYLATVAPISVTYSTLVNMVSAGTLNPEQTYLINDYQTKTTQPYTSASDLGFNVIVKAATNTSLYPEAKIIGNDDEVISFSYEKWKIWYDINNDTDKYLWADTVNGKGVIYRMIDEYDNDLPYDFKSISFWRATISTTIYDPADSGHTSGYIGFTRMREIMFTEGTTLPCPWISINASNVIWETLTTSGTPLTSVYGGEIRYFNTFNGADRQGRVSHVKMAPTYDVDGKQMLNNNIFLPYDDDVIYNVTFEPYCYNNTMRGCHNIKLGASCGNNVFGTVYNIELGNNCHKNLIYDASHNIKIDDQGTFNLIHYNCWDINIGKECSYITLVRNSSDFSCGSLCSLINLGSGLESATLGTGVQNLYAGTGYPNDAAKIPHIIAGNNCRYIKIAARKYNDGYGSTLKIEDGFNYSDYTYETLVTGNRFVTLDLNNMNNGETITAAMTSPTYTGYTTYYGVPSFPNSVSSFTMSSGYSDYLSTVTGYTGTRHSIGGTMYLYQTWELPNGNYGPVIRNTTGTTYAGPNFGFIGQFGNGTAYTRALILSNAGVTPQGSTTSLGSTDYRWSGIYSKTALNVSSDERLKTFKGDISISLDDLKSLPKSYFTWNDDEKQKVRVGTSAQAVQKLYPELVEEDEKGYLGIEYETLSVVALAAIDKLYDYCKSLEHRIEILEKQS